jgi:hypothetical protein
MSERGFIWDGVGSISSLPVAIGSRCVPAEGEPFYVGKLTTACPCSCSPVSPYLRVLWEGYKESERCFYSVKSKRFLIGNKEQTWKYVDAVGATSVVNNPSEECPADGVERVLCALAIAPQSHYLKGSSWKNNYPSTRYCRPPSGDFSDWFFKDGMEHHSVCINTPEWWDAEYEGQHGITNAMVFGGMRDGLPVRYINPPLLESDWDCFVRVYYKVVEKENEEEMKYRKPVFCFDYCYKNEFFKYNTNWRECYAEPVDGELLEEEEYKTEPYIRPYPSQYPTCCSPYGCKVGSPDMDCPATPMGNGIFAETYTGFDYTPEDSDARYKDSTGSVVESSVLTPVFREDKASSRTICEIRETVRRSETWSVLFDGEQTYEAPFVFCVPVKVEDACEDFTCEFLNSLADDLLAGTGEDSIWSSVPVIYRWQDNKPVIVSELEGTAVTYTSMERFDTLNDLVCASCNHTDMFLFSENRNKHTGQILGFWHFCIPDVGQTFDDLYELGCLAGINYLMGLANNEGETCGILRIYTGVRRVDEGGNVYYMYVDHVFPSNIYLYPDDPIYIVVEYYDTIHDEKTICKAIPAPVPDLGCAFKKTKCVCIKQIIASHVLKPNTTWDMTPYQNVEGVTLGAQWRLFETGWCTGYNIGIVDADGNLVGLPDSFSATASYDAYMSIYICCKNKDTGAYECPICGSR